MTDMRLRTRVLVLGALVLVATGCRKPHPGWEPPLEETSTRFLQVQVEEALQSMHRAQSELRGHPEQAQQRLASAVRALERMSKFYLPLLEARERTYDAHRFLYYGQTYRARTEIEAVEAILDGIAETGGTTLMPGMKESLDLVSEAKAAVIATSDDAPGLIKSLAFKLNLMTLRGGLDLPVDWPPSS